MRPTLRRLAVTSAATVIASGLAVPLATSPAEAVVATTERAFVVTDSDGDESNGLAWRPTPTGTTTAIDESELVEVSDASASRDGSRVVYSRTVYSADFETSKEQVVVRDAGGRAVRVVYNSAQAGAFVLYPLLSPSGDVAVFTVLNLAGSIGVYKVSVASGSATLLASDVVGLTFLDASTLLVQDAETGAASKMALSNGALSTFTMSGIATSATVSPDGGKIAYSLYNETADAATSLWVATLGSSEATGAVQVASTGEWTSPAFSADSATVYAVRCDAGCPAGTSDVWSVPADASAPAATTGATTADESAVAIGRLDAVAPGGATALPAVLKGTSATVRWTNPADADLSGVVVSRPGKSVFVPAPAASFVDSGLTLGSSYTYTLTAVDRSGNQASADTRTLTAIQPGAVFGTPTSQSSTTTSFPVRFATGAPASTQFFVDYQAYGSTWKSWVTGATGSTRTFGAPATTGVAATSVITGGTYTFRVKVVDAHGNASATVSSGKAVVPFDQGKAIFSGGTTHASSNAYLGSFRRLATAGQYARVSLVGSQLQVVGVRCPHCGAFDIYDGATKIGRVDTYASTLKPRVVLFSKTYASSGTHSFTLRAVGTPGRPYVALDGFAMRR